MDYDGKVIISLSYRGVKYNKMCDSQQSVHFVQTNDLKSTILINEGASLTLLVFVKS
mgnify:CR=1 FL=1